jgi:hypothetical protein
MPSRACVPCRLSLAAAVLAGLAASPAFSASSASGSFRYDKLTMEVTNAYAFREEQNDAPGTYKTYVYLTSKPVDGQVAANAFDPGTAIDAEIDDQPAGYVRLCFNADYSECGIYFSYEEPLESFNTSGYGKLELTGKDAKRVAGTWILAEPEDFFDKTYEFNLKFDAQVIAPTPGTALPADGGEPGKAYQAWLAAIAKGDFAALRAILGESGSWQFPEDDEKSAKENLKYLRDGKPVGVKILKGEQRGEQAILMVEGVDRDDLKLRGRVLMVKGEGGWRQEQSDLDSVE